MPKIILVPFDGSGNASRAIDYAGELKGLLVGSFSDKVFHHAEVPVTIVR